MEWIKSILWGAAGIIAVAMCLGGTMLILEYFERLDLQRRLKKEREGKE